MELLLANLHTEGKDLLHEGEIKESHLLDVALHSSTNVLPEKCSNKQPLCCNIKNKGPNVPLTGGGPLGFWLFYLPRNITAHGSSNFILFYVSEDIFALTSSP